MRKKKKAPQSFDEIMESFNAFCSKIGLPPLTPETMMTKETHDELLKAKFESPYMVKPDPDDDEPIMGAPSPAELLAAMHKLHQEYMGMLVPKKNRRWSVTIHRKNGKMERHITVTDDSLPEPKNIILEEGDTVIPDS